MASFEFFYGREHPLSQWYLSDFELDGIRFNSAEQWMMYAKAELFNDHEKATQILAVTDPSVQRKLGRQVHYFKEAIWEAQCRDILYKGNEAKFTQNARLTNYLTETGDAILAEASPTDLRWGIGLSISHPDRFNIAKWPGLNWLGQLLMQLRTNIRANS